MNQIEKKAKGKMGERWGHPSKEKKMGTSIKRDEDIHQLGKKITREKR